MVLGFGFRFLAGSAGSSGKISPSASEGFRALGWDGFGILCALEFYRK